MSARDDLRFCPRCASALAWLPAGDARLEHPTCTRCQFVLWQNPKPSVEALIVRERDGATEVLLGRRLGGAWDVPGNFLNEGDGIEDALVRECQREMGIEVRVDDIIGVYEDELAGASIVVIVYRCGLIAGDPHPADIIDAVEWFSVDRLPDIAYPSIARALDELCRRTGAKSGDPRA